MAQIPKWRDRLGLLPSLQETMSTIDEGVPVTVSEKENDGAGEMPPDNEDAVDTPKNEGTVEMQSKNEDAEEPRRPQRRASLEGDISFHPGLLELYTAPCQRQKWGDTQILPRVNWGDIFFDLWYVAAAYNCGNIIVDSPSGTGVLFFIGTFIPVMNMWMDKTYYDARYVVGDDLYHRIFEVAVLLVLSTAVLHIRPVTIMSNAKGNSDMFAFSLALLLGSALNLSRYIETFFLGKGQPCVIKQTSKRDLLFGVISFWFYLAASILSGLEYYSHDGGDKSSYSDANNTEAASAYDTGADDHHRSLAETSTTSSYSSSDTTTIPIWLCLFGPVTTYLFMCITVWFFFPRDGSHKDWTIPINVDFTIHRNGEWIMLMLGESILSLLIVDAPEGTNYYVTFYAGILTVILLQYLHFRSQPHHADAHAIRRNKDAAMIWRGIFMVYSVSLVCVGVSYKLFMYEFTYDDEHRRLEKSLWGDLHERWLADGGGDSSLTPEERRQSSANVFCTSMALVWFCQDFMLFLHNGYHKMQGKCYCEHTHKVKIKAAILLFLRLCLLVFIATLSQYETDPGHLALAGLAGVVAQLILRVCGTVIFKQPQIHQEMMDTKAQLEAMGELDDDEEDIDEERKWPNVTHARAVRKAEDDSKQEAEKC